MGSSTLPISCDGPGPDWTGKRACRLARSDAASGGAGECIPRSGAAGLPNPRDPGARSAGVDRPSAGTGEVVARSGAVARFVDDTFATAWTPLVSRA